MALLASMELPYLKDSGSTLDPNPYIPNLTARNPKPYNVGALIIKIGFAVYSTIVTSYNKEPPQNSIGIYLGPYITFKPCAQHLQQTPTSLASGEGAPAQSTTGSLPTGFRS